MLIMFDQFKNKEDYLIALEEEAEKCKSSALTIVESLEHSCYQVAFFDNIEKYLKYAEGSIKKARKIIKIEIQGRAANLHRQSEKLKQEKEQQENAND